MTFMGAEKLAATATLTSAAEDWLIQNRGSAQHTKYLRKKERILSLWTVSH
jgi:hypothetical protein